MKPAIERVNGRWGVRFPDGSFGPSIGVNGVRSSDLLLTNGVLTNAHFNTAGAWSREEYVPEGIWSTPEISFLGSFADEKGVPNKTAAEIRLIDDPHFPDWCQQRAAEMCVPRAGRIGYFPDNERAWDKSVTPGATMRKYLNIVVAAIRREDDQSLIYGPRLHRPCWGLKSAIGYIGEKCDALAINYYGVDAPEATRINTWYSWTNGKPTKVTEAYATATRGLVDGLKCNNSAGAGKKVTTQAQRAAFYQSFANGCMGNTRIIGWDWFRWDDDDGDGPPTFSGSKNCGLVGIEGTPYDELLHQAEISNRKWLALY